MTKYVFALLFHGVHACMLVTGKKKKEYFLLREARSLSSSLPGSDDVKAVWESREGACTEC